MIEVKLEPRLEIYGHPSNTDWLDKLMKFDDSYLKIIRTVIDDLILDRFGKYQLIERDSDEV